MLTAGDGYSLEEARKKREEDKLLAAADAKKRGVRAYVQELRTYAPARLSNIVFGVVHANLSPCFVTIHVTYNT